VSGQEIPQASTTVSSPSAKKADDIARSEAEFFDGMLIYGWIAKREESQSNVIEVNDSLRSWMSNNDLEETLSKIDHGTISIKELLEGLMHPDQVAVADIVEKHLIEITQQVDSLVYQDARRNELLEDVSEEGYTVQKTIRFVNDREHKDVVAGVLAGVRVVRPGAIRLRSVNERDRVDVIAVCQTVRTETGWRVVGYQGQLQQAWVRVQAVIRAGTKAGTIGLMGRNMSHNIGSHALFYFEMDEKDEKKKPFYRYLRERMELLAAFATDMSLSSSTAKLFDVIEEFKKNKEFLSRIAKSENVTVVEIVFEEGKDRDVALPGGVLSAQAFYSIFENNIRDSAKHGRTASSAQGKLTFTVTVRDAKGAFNEDFMEVVISDNRQNYEKAAPDLNASLLKMRIVDEIGKLEPGDWGIKERFISAALLRGRRLEEIEIQRQKDRSQEIVFALGEYAPDGEPRILDIENVEGNLGWRFYMLKPKNILLVGNFAPKLKDTLKTETLSVYDLAWLKENVSRPSKVLHRFVVFFPDNQSELDDFALLSDRLPYRVIVCLPEGLELPGEGGKDEAASPFAGIADKELNPAELSLDKLFRLWVNWLVEEKHPSPPPANTLLGRLFGRRIRITDNPFFPEVAFRDDKIKLLKFDKSKGTFHWEIMDEEKYCPQHPLVLFDRHGRCWTDGKAIGQESGETKLPVWSASCASFQEKVMHYESYDYGDALFRFTSAATNQIRRQIPNQQLDSPGLAFTFLEAGLIKVLIVDERIDPTSEEMTYAPQVKLWERSRKDLFKLKGVDIRGAEYAENVIPGPEVLTSWVADKGYDFLVLHKGIVDKLIKLENRDDKATPKDLMAKLFQGLNKHVRHIIIHSGRMSASELPPGVKFMALSNVDSWIKNNSPKMQIVEDLCLLRRT